MSKEPLIRLEDFVVGYDGRAMLPPVSMQIDAGEQWALIGPNGSGKTTLLRSMLGLLPVVRGEAVQRPDVNVGYVPQRTTIDGAMPGRVIDLVSGGVDHGWSFLRPLHLRQHRDDVENALVDAKASEFRLAQFSELSEGQKQRVLVARALASNPELLVLDEPTAAMDISAERDVFELLGGLRRKRGIAVIIVSHQLSVVSRHATHALLVDKDRKFASCGTMREIATHPETIARYGRLLQIAVEESEAEE